MVWRALSCDDLQSIDPATVSFSQLELKFLLRRTKTSGPGKKQGTLQVLYCVVSVFLDMTGLLLASRSFSWTLKLPRDFLCVHQVASRAYLELEGVPSLVRAVLRSLHVPQLKSGAWGLS